MTCDSVQVERVATRHPPPGVPARGHGNSCSATVDRHLAVAWGPESIERSGAIYVRAINQLAGSDGARRGDMPRFPADASTLDHGAGEGG